MKFHYDLMRCHTTLSRRIISRAQNELGLSLGQPKILDCLMDHEGCDQKTLAGYSCVEQSTLGTILQGMERKGLIDRQQKENNRRSLFIYLTDKGRESAEKMRRIFEEEDKKALNAFSSDEQEELEKLLRKIQENLERQQ